jgi:hypothetical protein
MEGCLKLAKMKTLSNTLNKELLKAQKNVQKIEVKYNDSKTEKNEYSGDNKIYKQFANAIQVRDILESTISKLTYLVN